MLNAFREHGAIALKSKKLGPKTNYRRTDEVVRQVIRYRFLDPDASAQVIAQKLAQTGWSISTRSVERVIAEFGLQKKLHVFRPDGSRVETQRTRRIERREPSDPASIERGVRQLLADKVSGTMVGVWLLIPEHLRLGTWDFLQGWSHQDSRMVEPRLALQLVHESALCVTGIRKKRSLSQKGFELANGLPFVATDQAIHKLLGAHTVADSQTLQLALGKIRKASGHYLGRLLAIDPHHMCSYSKRQTRRHRHKEDEKAVKTVQTFFCLDVDTGQPVAFTAGSSARTISQGTPDLLDLVSEILQPTEGETLILTDKEHFCADLFKYVLKNTSFDLLVPILNTPQLRKQMRSIPSGSFTPRWARLATQKSPYQFTKSDVSSLYRIVQRCGEKGRYNYKGFLSTRDCDEVQALIDFYPKRWHVEEFFNANQALGWNRAGTLNLNIRYGQMTMALIA